MGNSIPGRSHRDHKRTAEKSAMDTPNIVVQTEHNPVPPGRSLSLKLLGRETGDSIMMFEETIPAGTKSTLHLHHDSDEVAYVLSGEVTFRIGDAVTVRGPGACAFLPRGVPHAWKNTGAETGRVLFLYTPAGAGGFFEEQLPLPAPSSKPRMPTGPDTIWQSVNAGE